MITAVISTSIAVFASFYLYRKYYCHRVFKKIGLPGPEPHWLYGNLRELWAEPGKRQFVYQKWANQYGHFYGYYEGAVPILVTSSVEAVEQIAVKQFSNFQGHRIAQIQPDPATDTGTGSIFEIDIFFAWGQHWKRLRNHVSPGFSVAKMKEAMPIITKGMSQMVEIFKNKARDGETFNAHELWQRFSLDVVGGMAFGVDFDAIRLGERGETSEVLDHIRDMFALQAHKPAISHFTMIFSELAYPIKRLVKFVARYFGTGTLAPVAGMSKISREVVLQRVKNPAVRRNDILQTLIDNSELTTEKKDIDKPLNLDEITSQAMILLNAGTETSSTLLAFLSYLLPQYPEVQEKLFDEVFGAFPDEDELLRGGDIIYDKIMSLPYLDMVCKEGLRLYPIAFEVVTRMVMDDAEVCGVEIPKSIAAIFIDAYSIHHNQDLWGPQDVEKFAPERFSPEFNDNRPSAAFLGFGYGPKICVGMRLAHIEVKFAVANLIRRFKIHPPDGGFPKDGIPLISDFILAPRNGVPIKLSLR